MENPQTQALEVLKALVVEVALSAHPARFSAAFDSALELLGEDSEIDQALFAAEVEEDEDDEEEE